MRKAGGDGDIAFHDTKSVQGVALKRRRSMQRVSCILVIRFPNGAGSRNALGNPIGTGRGSVLMRTVGMKTICGTANLHLPPHNGSGIYVS